jgi:heme exporter protein A
LSTLLRFEGVALRRGGRLLFERLDLALGPGDALHLTGPNGSGKSSLIRLAAGLLRAEAGTVQRSAAALAGDLPALDRELPLAQALRLWAPEHRIGQPLEALGLAALAEVPVRLLSSGQSKRAALARVAASDAPLWLLDEPFNALDADGIARAERLIAAHRASGGAVLAASHMPFADGWPQLVLGR